LNATGKVPWLVGNLSGGSSLSHLSVQSLNKQEQLMSQRILVSDSLSDEGLGILRSGGFEVDYQPDISPAELEANIKNYDALVIRSRTTVTGEILRAGAPRLKVVGRAGVGLDNVDVPTATKLGIVVMNTPDGNTISTAEHTFSMIMSIAKSIPQAHGSMVAGKWDKKKYTGVELNGKKLGVIGLGRIGTTVANRGAAFGMTILAYDPFLSHDAIKNHGFVPSSIDDIVENADFITVHSPLNDSTRNMLARDQFNRMKPGVRIVNVARGGIINEADLYDALVSGKVAGAALDVFETEPLAADSPLRSLPNVVLTPHLGAATTEAQENVAKDIASQIVDALSGGPIRNAANAPRVDPATLALLRPYMDLVQRMGKFLGQILAEPPVRLTIYYSGSVLDHPTAAITTAAVIGFLEAQSSSGTVNFVNALPMAKERGLEVVEEKSTKLFGYSNLITVEATHEDGSFQFIGGTVFTPDNPRIVNINDKFFDVVPEGHMVMIENKDVPGIIGNVGTVLGEAGINISQMTWGRTQPGGGGDAITVANLDQELPEALLEKLGHLPNILSVKRIRI
jgi:D-3-phosphoglycerate dehydrogenase